jgi:hypothetical protein
MYFTYCSERKFAAWAASLVLTCRVVCLLTIGYPTSFAAPTGDPWFVAYHGGETVNEGNFNRTSGQAIDEEEDFRALQVGVRRPPFTFFWNYDVFLISNIP